MKRVAVAVFWLVAMPAAIGGEMYKCTDADGKVVFSQAKCAPDAQPLTLDIVRPTDAQVQARLQWAEESKRATDERIAQQRAARAEAGRQGEMDAATARHDAEQASIAERRARTNNNIAGAALEGALATDAAASDARYKAEMERLKGVKP